MAHHAPRRTSRLRLRSRPVLAMITTLALAGTGTGMAQPAPGQPAAPGAPSAGTDRQQPGSGIAGGVPDNGNGPANAPSVIQPPSQIDPGIQAPVPEPRPNTTPVIPPPGSATNRPNIQPR